MFEGAIGDMLSEVNELRLRMEAEKNKIVALGSGELFKMFTPYFERDPKLESLSWVQYAPYFNDGDECTFSVESNYFDMVYDGKEHSGAEYRLKQYDFETNKTLEVAPYVRTYSVGGGDSLYFFSEVEGESDVVAAVGALVNLLEGLGDDLCLAIWGNHAKVTLSREGFAVEDYDHD